MLELPAGLESLGAYAFNGSGLTSATVPEGITELPERAFSSCKQLTEVTLPESITAIGAGAFSYSGIEYFVMPEGVTVLEESVFAGCYSLTEVVLSENLTTIGASAFRGSDSLPYAVQGKGQDRKRIGSELCHQHRRKRLQWLHVAFLYADYQRRDRHRGHGLRRLYQPGADSRGGACGGDGGSGG